MPMTDKVSKVSVHYGKAKHPQQERCGICTMFSKSRCSLVAGYISSMAWCDKFEPRRKPNATR